MPEVAANSSDTVAITLLSPFTYTDTLLTGYYADADGYLAAFGQPRLISMAGGAIPIATARELVGSVVSVEGIATMYTGGFLRAAVANFTCKTKPAAFRCTFPANRRRLTWPLATGCGSPASSSRTAIRWSSSRRTRPRVWSCWARLNCRSRFR